MAANTFLETTNSLRLYVPQLPITLAQQFIRDRYRRILERKDWSALRKEAEFILSDAKTVGTVAITRGTATVTGTGTAFASTDIGRQFKTGVGSPIYTITDVNVGGQILTLDRNFGGAAVTTATYFILDAYLTVPSDFLRFISVVDPLQGWQLRHWVTSEELMTLDPQRTFMGQPYVLADRMYSSAGIPQYEAWPYCTTARTLYYTYVSRATDFVNDNDRPIWPLRSDVIVAGALADVARGPGTTEKPNPYFGRPDWWKTYESTFEDMMIELERRDEEVYMTMLQQYPYNQGRMAPMSASFIQSHAI